MIYQLGPGEIRECRDLVEENYRKYSSIFYTSPELVINQIMRGDLAIFNVNNEMLAFCRRHLEGNESSLFVLFAFSLKSEGFFNFRKAVRENLEEISEYVKRDLGCDRLDFLCVSNAHTNMYQKLLNGLNKQMKCHHYFKVTL